MGESTSNRLTVFTRMTDLEGTRRFEFPDIRGWMIQNTTGHEVGQVEEVWVDPNTLRPGLVLLHYKKFMNRNTKKLLVPWEEMLIGDTFVQTRPTEEELLPETVAQMPPTQPADTLSPGSHVTADAPGAGGDSVLAQTGAATATVADPDIDMV